MPVSIPRLPSSFLDNISLYSFEELSFIVAQNLIGEYIQERDIYGIINRAINFSAPVVDLDDRISTLELFHGPSMAFKDFGARFMAELMSYFLRYENRKTTILVATSGDTGGAVAAGFFQIPNIEVKILYPSGKVSALQEKQLTTWGKNIEAIEIDGTFDDCQRLVKEAFLNEDLKKKYAFSSANSINIARLIPQSFYYFEAYKQVHTESSKIVFSVPSGNFGNLTAGLLAKRMGLNVYNFLAATNINDTVPQYLLSGTYNPKTSMSTISNAMDVGAPSNFVRMTELYHSGGSTWNAVKKDVSGYSYTDVQTESAMQEIKEKYNYTADPHGAVGYLACKDYLLETPDAKCVFLETAHPGKFEDVVSSALSEKLTLPEKLNAFLSKDKSSIKCSSKFEDFKEVLMSL